jgi:hypothetical protein
MALLDKGNPRATRASVVRWACGGACMGLVFSCVSVLQSDMPITALFFIVPWTTLGSAVAAATVEWQVSD